jgi:hypothetical protein
MFASVNKSLTMCPCSTNYKGKLPCNTLTGATLALQSSSALRLPRLRLLILTF